MEFFDAPRIEELIERPRFNEAIGRTFVRAVKHLRLKWADEQLRWVSPAMKLGWDNRFAQQILTRQRPQWVQTCRFLTSQEFVNSGPDSDG